MKKKDKLVDILKPPPTFIVEEQAWHPSVMGPMVSYRVIEPEHPETKHPVCYGIPLYELLEHTRGNLRKTRRYRITVEVIEEGPPLGENPWKRGKK